MEVAVMVTAQKAKPRFSLRNIPWKVRGILALEWLLRSVKQWTSPVFQVVAATSNSSGRGSLRSCEVTRHSVLLTYSTVSSDCLTSCQPHVCHREVLDWWDFGSFQTICVNLALKLSLNRHHSHKSATNSACFPSTRVDLYLAYLDTCA